MAGGRVASGETCKKCSEEKTKERGKKMLEIMEMKEGEIKGGKAKFRKGEDAVK